MSGACGVSRLERDLIREAGGDLSGDVLNAGCTPVKGGEASMEGDTGVLLATHTAATCLIGRLGRNS